MQPVEIFHRDSCCVHARRAWQKATHTRSASVAVVVVVDDDGGVVARNAIASSRPVDLREAARPSVASRKIDAKPVKSISYML